MSLKTYRRKRDFTQTPEPRGRLKQHDGGLHFVIQKHAASHLHYDLRLENEGVLKSWAVPKGPSTDPGTRRLAMAVEDHPLSYGDFEGTIPEGNYGAGKVIVWDNGEYFADKDLDKKENEKIIKKGLAQGHLRFYLDGKKLKGQFSLIKLKGRENQWFLIKKDDDYAHRAIKDEEKSVKTGRRIEEVGEEAGINFEGAKKAAFPHSLSPMMATLGDEPFDRREWIFEVKWDGYRILAEIQEGRVRLYSRRDKNYTEVFKVVSRDLERMPHQAMLDGEVVAVDEQGISRFQLLQNYMRRPEGRLLYYVFDILHLDHYDLHDLPLSRRREILRAVLTESETVRLSGYVEEHGKAFYREAKKMGLEGIIAKDLKSRYRFGQRTPDWVKIKAVAEQEAVICGFTAPRGSRKYFGSLILGLYQEGKLIYVGHTGGGFTDEGLKEMRGRLQPLITDQCPFEAVPKTNAPVQWVKPQLVAQVKFQEWTEGGNLRQPIFLGLREDKTAREVKREVPAPVAALIAGTTEENRAPAVTTRAVLSNLDKIYWPEEGYTKGDMIRYYQEIAPFILPYLKDRPQSLHRHPNGINDKGFFQKDAKDEPDWIKTVDVDSESKEKIHYLLCQDKDSLAYINNLGCIEINPWNSTADDQDHPDYLVLDLDPVDIAFSKVVDVTLKAKEILDHAQLRSFCKTSGGRGMHIYLPLRKKYTFDQTKDFTHFICMLIHKQCPGYTSLERSPQKRKGMVYLDYLQNKIGATMAAPYSLRPRPGAPVSTPLEWSEVTPRLDPQDFTLKNIRARLAKKGDLWKGVLGPGINMPHALKILEKEF